jgi:hypothetical protein
MVNKAERIQYDDKYFFRGEGLVEASNLQKNDSFFIYNLQFKLHFYFTLQIVSTCVDRLLFVTP